MQVSAYQQKEIQSTAICGFQITGKQSGTLLHLLVSGMILIIQKTGIDVGWEWVGGDCDSIFGDFLFCRFPIFLVIDNEVPCDTRTVNLPGWFEVVGDCGSL